VSGRHSKPSLGLLFVLLSKKKQTAAKNQKQRGVGGEKDFKGGTLVWVEREGKSRVGGV